MSLRALVAAGAVAGAVSCTAADGGMVERLEFVSACIELYEKREGKWLRVGNVSNFKPGA